VKTRVLLLCLAMLCNPATAFSIAFDSTGQAQATANADEKAEVALPDQGIAIRVNVNLVQMRVVVRDSTGKPVEGLRREDFQLYDRGKLQSITAFEVETPESRRTKREALAKAQTVEGLSAGGGKFSFPDRFVALVIDDTHLSIQDAVHVKMLAGPFLEAVAQTDRVGVFSTSGQLTQDFTNDTDVVKRVLSGISPRPLVSNVRATGSRFECPHVTYGMAEQIENNHDAQAMYGVVMETLQCAFRGDKEKLPYAQSMAQTAVHQVLRAGEAENGMTFRYLEAALHRLAMMPGERIMVLVSPGFLLAKHVLDDAGMVEQANRAGIVINTLDVRGLYVPRGGEDMWNMDVQREQSTVLASFAYGTGGTFFHNSNDLGGGLRMAVTSPEICYVLGYAPKNLKPDGRYHTIEVVLIGKQKYSIQARRGYYAPRKMNLEEQQRQEIDDAVFSREEMGNLLLDLQAQSLTQGKAARVNVLSQVAVRSIHFRKSNGKNADILRLVTAIFDNNGNYVTGVDKVVTMKLDDTEYEELIRTGMTVQLNFDLKPGKYLVRQLARDSATGQMSARNRTVVIGH